MSGPLVGVRVLDLSRILAGPSCAQLLGDLGADVIKVERPGRGDDTRRWGPPFVERAGGRAIDAAYYLAANRNKRSIAIDLGRAEGAALVRELALRSDVLLENFKAGDLDRRGLGARALLELRPSLVYCSITGFGQTGPRASEPGYDLLAQAMGGIMSLTGDPAGPPMKVGVGIADLFTGMYAAVAILAALRHRDLSGSGQHIDLALLDSQLSWLANAAQDYFVAGVPPARFGNAHPHIVPYDVFATADEHIVLAVGNDEQWRRFCEVAGLDPSDPRFATNADRVRARGALRPILERALLARSSGEWIERLRRAEVPCGPVHDLARAFDDPQAIARGMRVSMSDPSSKAGTTDVVGNPIKLSRTPVSYRLPPPLRGQHTSEVLREVLGSSDAEIARLIETGVVEGDCR